MRRWHGGGRHGAVRRGVAAVAATAVLAGAAGCTGENGDAVAEYTIGQSREDMRAAAAEVGRVLEAELGADGWFRPSEESLGECGDGVGRFRTGNRATMTPVPAERWDEVWSRIRDAVAAHGYTDQTDDPATGGSHFRRLLNAHGDTLTVSVNAGESTVYGGDSACHPGWTEVAREG